MFDTPLPPALRLPPPLPAPAGYQSAADRHILWGQRNEKVPEFGVSVEQFMNKMSALRQVSAACWGAQRAGG